jgi:signal recognition particle receptor subunit beta
MQICTSKVVIRSNSKVAISEFVQRLPGQVCTENGEQTVGADFTISERDVGDKAIHLYIWTVSNHPSFSLLRQYYLQGAKIYVMFIDASKPESIQQIAEWNAEASKVMEKTIRMIVATNINRVPDHVKVEETIGELARKLGLEVMLVSTETKADYTDAIKTFLERVDRTAMASCT